MRPAKTYVIKLFKYPILLSIAFLFFQCELILPKENNEVSCEYFDVRVTVPQEASNVGFKVPVIVDNKPMDLSLGWGTDKTYGGHVKWSGDSFSLNFNEQKSENGRTITSTTEINGALSSDHKTLTSFFGRRVYQTTEADYTAIREAQIRLIQVPIEQDLKDFTFYLTGDVSMYVQDVYYRDYKSQPSIRLDRDLIMSTGDVDLTNTGNFISVQIRSLLIDD